MRGDGYGDDEEEAEFAIGLLRVGPGVERSEEKAYIRYVEQSKMVTS